MKRVKQIVVFQIRMTKVIFGLERQEETGGSGKLKHKEKNDVFNFIFMEPCIADLY